MQKGIKKPLHIQGLGIYAHSPHLADGIYPPELAPFLVKPGGLPGFVGPSPSTSLDESYLIVLFNWMGRIHQ